MKVSSGSSLITASNYVAVGEQVLASSLQFSPNSPAPYFRVDPSTPGFAQALSVTAKPQLAKVFDQFSRPQQIKAAAAEQQTQACSLGGSVTMSVTDRNNNGVEDVGDSATLKFSNCHEDTETMNGSVTILINKLSGDINSNIYSRGFSISFSNLSISSGSGGSKLDGSFDLTLNSVGINNQTYAISAPSLVIDEAVNGASYSARMSNFNFGETVTPAGSGSRSSITFGGTLSSSAMAAQSNVSVKTLSPFVRDSRAAYPASGQVLITSAAGGQVRLTVQNESTVLFEVDADSNGIYETQQSRSWSQLI